MHPVLQQAITSASEHTEAGRHQEAREALEDLDIIEVLPQLEPEDLFAYYERYGKALGELGDLKAMDDTLTQAMTLAAEQLGDMGRVRDTWYWMLQYPKEHEDWGFLERQSHACSQFGVAAGSGSLRQMAAEFCAYAHRGLGKEDMARRGAMKILRRLESLGAEKARLQEWKNFLAELG